MELDDINVVRFKCLQAGLHILENALFRCRGRGYLRRHVHLVTHAFQCFGDDFLVLASHVSSRRVDIVDAMIKGDLHHLRLRGQHGPEADNRNLQSCPAQGSIDRHGKDEGLR